MKASNEDKAKGAFHEAKGGVKEEAGKLMHHPELEEEGSDEKLAGKLQKGVGKIEKALGE